MDLLTSYLESLHAGPFGILDADIPINDYVSIDFSKTNPELKGLDVGKAEVCQAYIDRVLKRKQSQVAYGGYLEVRNLYDNPQFVQHGDKSRNIHLAMDFWAPAGTIVRVPLPGRIYSYADNAEPGNYGPTIILEHKYASTSFYSLFGHLSRASLETLEIGRQVDIGDSLAALGTSDINVGYAPHLHFQLIQDMQDHKFDYPGVGTKEMLDYYKTNCPDPNLLLKL